MSQAPTDTTGTAAEAQAQAQAQAPAATDATNNTTDPNATKARRPSNTEVATQKLKAFGTKLKEAGQKAVEKTKEFVADTEDDIKNTKSMSGLLKMAGAEFEAFIRLKCENAANKKDILKLISDSFKNAAGICFVASFNVAFVAGGSYGRGIVMKRLGSGKWSLPLAIEEIEGSLGLQLNVSRSKTFFLLKNEQSLQNFLSMESIKLGGKGFAALGNIGVQAQGDVTATRESIQKNSGTEPATTNSTLGTVKGLGFGVSGNIGTFKVCDKINTITYDNFDKTKIFETECTLNINEKNEEASNNNEDEKKSEEINTNDVKDASGKVINKLQNEELRNEIEEFLRLVEGIITNAGVANEAADAVKADAKVKDIVDAVPEAAINAVADAVSDVDKGPQAAAAGSDAKLR